MTNPTTPGMHNHLHPPEALPDPSNPRKAIDRVFGVDAPIIEGIPIEVGHGSLPVEVQLAEHVARIKAAEGEVAARSLIRKLLASFALPTPPQFNSAAFHAELVSRGLARPIPEAARKGFDESQPSGAPN